MKKYQVVKYVWSKEERSIVASNCTKDDADDIANDFSRRGDSSTEFYKVIEQKQHEFIEAYGDGELYAVNDVYYMFVWDGLHNKFNTDICVYQWYGLQHLYYDELPNTMHSDWEAIQGFDFETNQKNDIDWIAYRNKVDEILNEIEKNIGGC